MVLAAAAIAAFVSGAPAPEPSAGVVVVPGVVPGVVNVVGVPPHPVYLGQSGVVSVNGIPYVVGPQLIG